MTRLQRILAWCAHAYTALGLVCAAAMAVLIIRGDDAAVRLACLLMIVATTIDATDGWFARRVRVSVVLPGFDGRRLDDLIDFLTYTCLPLLLVWRTGLVGEGNAWWVLAPLLASAYGFSQVDAKTEDGYFLGFPSYWNIVAAYLYLLALPHGWALAVLLVFALLTFVPTRYLYPSASGGLLNVATNLFGVVWAIVLLVIVWQWHAAPRWLVVGSLSYPAYYLVVSWWISLRIALRGRAES